jgi:hypothetical protein
MTNNQSDMQQRATAQIATPTRRVRLWKPAERARAAAGRSVERLQQRVGQWKAWFVPPIVIPVFGALMLATYLAYRALS